MCVCACVSVDILLRRRRKSSFARVMTKPRCWTTLGGLLLAVVATVVPVTHGCTNVLVTPEATTDGSAMIAYNADSDNLFGYLYHYPPTHDNPEGTMREIYEWDTGVSILCLATHTRAPSCSTTLFLLNSHQQTRTHTHTRHRNIWVAFRKRRKRTMWLGTLTSLVFVSPKQPWWSGDTRASARRHYGLRFSHLRDSAKIQDGARGHSDHGIPDGPIRVLLRG